MTGLTPTELRYLRDRLELITGDFQLWTELEDAFTRQTSRPGPPDKLCRTRRVATPLPYDAAASNARRRLRSALAEIAPKGDVVAMATWTARNLHMVSARPDAHTAYERVCAGVAEALAAISNESPQSQNEPMTPAEIERQARNLGDPGRGLTRRRLHTLREAGYIAPHSPGRYLLTDVLKAHNALPQRRKSPGNSHA